MTEINTRGKLGYQQGLASNGQTAHALLKFQKNLEKFTCLTPRRQL